ncbi:MAG: energy transducer TonB [Fluviicola sp.]
MRLLAIFVLLPIGLFAQDTLVIGDKSDSSKARIVLTECIYLPSEDASYNGGRKAMLDFIRENCVYPLEARKQGIEGKVWVQFIVNHDGSLVDVEVIQKVHPLLDAEALRLVKSMPNWKNEILHGKDVRTRVQLPIDFVILD